MTSDDELVMFVQNDISGLTRGRSFPHSQLERRWTNGVGWVPADQAITSLGPLAEPNPWGPMGDVRLIPDPTTELRVTLPDAPPLHLVLCDIKVPDGTPWDACARTFARDALAKLQADAGLGFVAAFEHEFSVSRPGMRVAPGFTVAAQREAEPFVTTLTGALIEAGLEPDTILPEFGELQFEVTLEPVAGIASADRAVALREVVREVGRALGYRCVFSPVVDPDGANNGVHVHFSLLTASGESALYDEGRAAGLSEVGGHFVGGIMAHLPALVALTAPSPISYLRLVPHHWSAAYTALGERNREAAIRICPVMTFADAPRGAQYNLEYRAADAAASPYLVLGALARAGLDGITRGCEPPPILRSDPSGLTDEERARLGIERLPTSLDAALAALEADEVVRSWFSDDLWACYFTVKRLELALVDSMTVKARCARYAEVY